MAHYIPIMLDLRGCKCLLVGGGLVAERKVVTLLPSGAEILIVSPRLTPKLKQTWQQGQITWIQRCYQKGDLQGSFMVFATTDQPSVNDQIAAEAQELGIMINHSGEGARGSFISPSSFRRGDLVVAVSTSGAAPEAAKRVCAEIEEQFGDEHEEYIRFLSWARQVIKKQVHDVSRRRLLFKKLAAIDVLKEIRTGKFSLSSENDLISWINVQQEE
ncbi:bifunctional precorrin-2 dehydrogenase/sirohydrochlorin ferrochelatase [Paenibacillus sp. D2_2]|uniref:precorrin-2 dehydrogenase/sirohydrochlorin ferrochelatase family protein n=1 Tax=Paenibacillus sp. D2_2 TaxID=3073092 RepID=UPI002814CEBF|nr:bifunctional precorrin-2 dehydrogenase/sirohydrochlorin ferrochelatase [Paenibacillus sp. D2_2]WMT40138.1 bifunctional precorrin-2 dehydrogenase/sirohydrochlorin ferrochelatase [Paenibacillus sp. D2_2]